MAIWTLRLSLLGSLALTTSACTAFLGIDYLADDSEGGPDATSEYDAPVSAMADGEEEAESERDAGSDNQEVAASPDTSLGDAQDATVSASDSDSEIGGDVSCTPDSTPSVCSASGIPQWCDSSGQWRDSPNGPCAGSTPTCKDGKCVECSPDVAPRRCSGTHAVQTCQPDGKWGSAVACPTLCKDSACLRAIAVSAGWTHTCAILSDGLARCWGDNQSAELGYNNFGGWSAKPMMVSGVADATALAAGNEFTCAIVSGGGVLCWGKNDSGQLGNVTPAGAVSCSGTSCSAMPVPVQGVTNATALGAGRRHACALLATGTVQCWGANFSGQLGNGTTASSTTPVMVSGLTAVTAISVGDDFNCALLSNGRVLCWGQNWGSLGTGSRYGPETCPLGGGDCATTPVLVSGLPSAIGIAVGGGHACARVGGSAMCWGGNEFGELGNDSGDAGIYCQCILTPSVVPGLTDISGLAAGYWHTCALQSGAAVCWGINMFGELGAGSAANSSTQPLRVMSDANITVVSAGFDHTAALTADGAVLTWGSNGDGALGVTSTTFMSRTPLPVIW